MFRTTLLVILAFSQQTLSLDNGVATTPPMGFMSWQRFRCLIDCEEFPNECISETLFKRIADKMASDGYKDAGYEYIIIDDCWAEKTRDEDNHLRGDLSRFPNGMKNLSDYIHNLGLKLGIYGDYGTETCGGYPGSLDYLDVDAQTYADWGVDYLKLDGCYVELEGMEEGYANMSRYLNATGRPIVFSCSFPAYLGLEANYSMAEQYCNLWRNYGDIDDSWADVRDIATWFADNQDFLRQYAGPGHWNDPDMLIIGNFGLSLEQSKAQMTIWAILSAPLLMSVDLDTITTDFKDILLNTDAISINQDALGIQGELVNKTNKIMVWTKPLVSDGLALGLVSNRTDGYYYPYNVTLQNYVTKLDVNYTIKNVFEDEDDITVSTSETLLYRIPPSGAVLLLCSPVE